MHFPFQSLLLRPCDFAPNVTSTTYLIVTIRGASRETGRLEVVVHPCGDFDEVDLEDTPPNTSLKSHLRDAQDFEPKQRHRKRRGS